MADLAIRVWGKDFKRILTRAAEGLYDVMGVKFDKTSQKDREFTIEYHDQENLIVEFLNELLFLCVNDQIFLDSMVFIERSDAFIVQSKTHKVQHIEREIKAITYHALEIIENDKGLETTITFDI